MTWYACPNGHPLQADTAVCPVCGAPIYAAGPSQQLPADSTAQFLPADAPYPPADAPYPPAAGPASEQPYPAAGWASEQPYPAAAPASGQPYPPAGWAPYPPSSTPYPADAAAGGGQQGPRPARRRTWLVAGAVAVVLGLIAAGVGLSFVGSSSSNTSSNTTAPKNTTTSGGAATENPTTSTTTSPASQPGYGAAQTISQLLSQSTSDRQGVVAAVADINNCGDVASDQSTLDNAAQGRQALIDQVKNLDVTSLPNGATIQTDLVSAWNDSLESDQAYAGWASDESGGCTPDDTSDPNYQQAAAADTASTQAKQAFVGVWDPVAAQYRLPTVTASQI